MITIDIVTLFPQMFNGPLNESIMWRAQDQKLAKINIHDLRQWGMGERKTVDGRPYGGGVGMILMIEPIYNALKSLRKKNSHVIAFTAQGTPLKQKRVEELSKSKHLILLAGHYEGFDGRILANLVDEEISIGDYVLTGGEIPAMVLTDAVVRLVPGVLAKSDATALESFSDQMGLEHSHYTRPEVFKGWKVPSVLLSGNHKEINQWKKEKSLQLTKKRRPDLIG